jgi:predicted DNA-binding transcriptional regulator AlpA
MQTLDINLLHDESLLTTAEVCETWRLNKGSFRNLVSQGRGPAAVRIGRSLRFTLKSVRQWIAYQSEPLSSRSPGWTVDAGAGSSSVSGQ